MEENAKSFSLVLATEEVKYPDFCITSSYSYIIPEEYFLVKTCIYIGCSCFHRSYEKSCKPLSKVLYERLWKNVCINIILLCVLYSSFCQVFGAFLPSNSREDSLFKKRDSTCWMELPFFHMSSILIASVHISRSLPMLVFGQSTSAIACSFPNNWNSLQN